MKDNKGYSLVEIMVVIAIIAILLLVGITGLGFIGSANLNSCTEEIKTAVGKTRITTMGKDEAILRIYQGSDGYYKEEIVNPGTPSEEIETAEKIGKSNLTLTYTMVDDTNAFLSTATIDSTHDLRIGFDRSSGAQRELVTGAGRCSQIDISLGSRTRSVIMVPATGKVYTE